ncbi:hypothetical protein L6R53_10040 [Myxococcota bacterium]|nr:hypothetical protein [Myxococcota bacterium]
MAAASSPRLWLLGLALLVGAGGALGAWRWWAGRAPAPVEEADGDTGLTREQTEEMMRVIGYVQ